jgi:hypothetical protein
MLVRPLILIYFTFLLLSSWRSFADDDSPTKTIVLLIENEQFIDSEAVISTIRSQLGDLPVRFEIERTETVDLTTTSLESKARQITEQGPRIVAVVWLDRKNSGLIHFLLRDEGGTNIIDRGIGEGETASIRAESLALILRATVQALIEDETAQPPNRAADEKAPPAAETAALTVPPASKTLPEQREPKQKTTAQEGPPLFGLETAYAYRAYSEDIPALSGFHVGLHLRLGALVHLFVEYEVRQTLDATGTCVKTSVRSHPIGLGGRLLWQQGFFTFGPSLGLTIDIATSQATTFCYQVDALSDNHRINLSFAPAFMAAARIYKRLHLFVFAEADIMWRAGRYTATSKTGEQEVLLEPWRVQPSATAGFYMELF